MRARIAWLAGAVGVAGAAAYRTLRRKPAPSAEDPRAEELRRKLEESRVVVEEREQFEAAETPVDKAPEPPPDAEVEARRKAVHERGHAAAEDMRDRSAE